jgi:hypothetical protein
MADERDRIVGREEDGTPVVVCPECGGTYSHIREVFTRMGVSPGEAVVYPGTGVRGRVIGERRSALVVVLDGECGHAWELRLQQHKGINELVVVPAEARLPLSDCRRAPGHDGCAEQGHTCV